MPNWCYNDLEVWTDNSESARKEMIDFKKSSIIEEKVIEDDGTIRNRTKFTFEGAEPMPSTLRITSGSTIDEAITYLKAKDKNYKQLDEYFDYKWVKEDIIDSKDSLKQKRAKLLAHFEGKLEVNDVEEGRLALENLEKYGSKDWYDWSIRTWGTKWDAGYTTHEDDDEDMCRYSFETAWSPPMGWLQSATTKWPNLLFKMRVSEESEAFMGMPVAQGGEVVENLVDIRYPEPINS